MLPIKIGKGKDAAPLSGRRAALKGNRKDAGPL